MTTTLNRIACGTAAALLFGIVAGSSGAAQEPDPFYKGRQMNLIIGFNPGGGYDTYARLLSRHMPRHIGGDPTFVLRNMPGGGSLIAANHLYNIAAKDGSEMGLFAGSVATDPAIGGVPAKYDARKFNWVGSAYSDVATCFAWAATPFKSASDLFQQSMVTGSVGNSATLIFPLAMNGVLGAKLNIVSGYQGSAGLNLALERGEIQGICGASLDSLQSSTPQWIADKKIVFLAQMTFQRKPQLPGVPKITELAKSEEERKVLELIFSYMRMGRPLAAPPGIPEPRTAILRRAFEATMQDAAFIEEAQKSGLEIDPTSGQEMDRFLVEIYQTPKTLIDRASEILQRATK